MLKFERSFIQLYEPYVEEDPEDGLRLFRIEFKNGNGEDSNIQPNDPDSGNLPEEEPFQDGTNIHPNIERNERCLVQTKEEEEPIYENLNFQLADKHVGK